MKSRLISFGIAAGLLGVGIGFVACSSGGSGGGGGTTSLSCPAGATKLTLQWSPGYTGTDGTTSDVSRSNAPVTVQLPAWVSGDATGKYTWTTSSKDVSVSTTDPNIDVLNGGAMLTVAPTLAATETVTVMAQSAAGCGTAQITVEKYDAGLFELGSNRYWNGINDDAGSQPAIPDPTVLAPYYPSIADASIALPDGAVINAGTFQLSRIARSFGAKGKPCADCHQATSNPSAGHGVSHTPEQTGGYSDTDLQNAYVNGVIFQGGYFEQIPILIPLADGGADDGGILQQGEWTLFHQWHFASDAEKEGVLIYLRSLTPKASDGNLESTGGPRRDGGVRGDGGGFGRDGGGPPPGNDAGPPPAIDAGGGTDAGTVTSDAGAVVTDAATGG